MFVNPISATNIKKNNIYSNNVIPTFGTKKKSDDEKLTSTLEGLSTINNVLIMQNGNGVSERKVVNNPNSSNIYDKNLKNLSTINNVINNKSSLDIDVEVENFIKNKVLQVCKMQKMQRGNGCIKPILYYDDDVAMYKLKNADIAVLDKNTGKSYTFDSQEETLQKGSILDTKIEKMDLSSRTFTALKRWQKDKAIDLVDKDMSDKSLMNVRNFGEKCLDEVVFNLNMLGLDLLKEGKLPEGNTINFASNHLLSDDDNYNEAKAFTKSIMNYLEIEKIEGNDTLTKEDITQLFRRLTPEQYFSLKQYFDESHKFKFKDIADDFGLLGRARSGAVHDGLRTIFRNATSGEYRSTITGETIDFWKSRFPYHNSKKNIR